MLRSMTALLAALLVPAAGCDLSDAEELASDLLHMSEHIDVESGTFIAEEIPSASDHDSAPTLHSVEATGVLINGGSTILPLSFSDADGSVAQVIVGLDGHLGYFVVDVSDGQTETEVVLLVDKDTSLEGADFHIAVIDDQGHISDFLIREFEVVQTGTGDVKVSLFFDQDVDLDLHVVEPSGEEIFYAAPESSTGGHLDLDSNPACNIDDINNENIYWPEGAAPAGEYIVRVDYYEACSPEPVDYLVTIHAGEEVMTYSGTFDETQADGGSEDAGLEIARFTYGG